MRFKFLRKITAFAAGALMAAGIAIPTLKTPVKAADEIDMNLVLCIYAFGDAYTTERGASVNVTGEGQYTLEFDCASDLSEAAAGETGINKFGSIYITDADVLDGLASSSPVSTCNIVYDSITVDDKELTIVNKDAKSAIKASGIVDTNDPLNAWDGSVVSEDEIVWDKTNFTISFAGMENPQKISVTFTLSNITAQDIEQEETTEEETESETEAETETETEATADETTAEVQNNEDSSNGLPIGAVVGIVAAVVVVIVIIIVAASSKKKKK